MYRKNLQNVLILSLCGLYVHAQTFTIPSQPLGNTWAYLNPSIVGTNSGTTRLRFDQVSPPEGEFTTTDTIARTVLVSGNHYIESNKFFTLDCTIPSNKGNVFTCADAFIEETTVNGKSFETTHTDPITFDATTVVVTQRNTASAPTETSKSASKKSSPTLGHTTTLTIPVASQPRIGTGNLSPTQSSGSGAVAPSQSSGSGTVSPNQPSGSAISPNQSNASVNSSSPTQSGDGGNSTSPTDTPSGGIPQVRASISYLCMVVALSVLSIL